MKEKMILAFERPDLLKEWDFEKNALICSPDDITLGSSKYVYWICSEGHSYKQKIANRVSRNLKCPFCSHHRLLTGHNDLKTLFPEIAKEWHPTKNGNLNPNQITARNSNKVWWICKKGHEWQATVASRTDTNAAHKCPYCSNRKLLKGFNDLETKHPNVAKEWNYEKNCGLLPSDVIAGTPKKVWWKCSKCGFEYYSQVASRTTMSSGCPKCDRRSHTSFPEQAIYYYVSKCFSDAINSYRSEWLGKQEIDVFIPSLKVGIEYDGIHWHKSKRNVDRDKKKYKLLHEHGIYLIRITEFEYPILDYCDYIIIRNNIESRESLDNCIENLFNKLGNDVSFEIDSEKDSTKIMGQYYSELKKNSLKSKFPEIANEWDYEKNGGITPDMVPIFSNASFYWKCSQNHSYKVSVYSRSRQDGKATGCPFCSNKKILMGYNDLATLYPNLLKEWDFEKNGDLKPNNVLPGTNKKVWWICKKGHSYFQLISNHVQMHHGCPYCAGKITDKGKNDLATLYPNLLKEWDYEKNTSLPEDFTAGSSKKVWWKCVNEHSYESMIISRTRKKTGCPICANQVLLKGFNDLKTKNPEIADEWDYEKNVKKPNEVTYGSHDSVWWTCNQCGHNWKSKIVNRTRNLSGCPKCARDKVKTKLRVKVKCKDTGVIYNSTAEAAEWAGVSKSLIGACARGKIKRAAGYQWEYVND